jgi:hypothetical protein
MTGNDDRDDEQRAVPFRSSGSEEGFFSSQFSRQKTALPQRVKSRGNSPGGATFQDSNSQPLPNGFETLYDQTRDEHRDHSSLTENALHQSSFVFISKSQPPECDMHGSLKEKKSNKGM